MTLIEPFKGTYVSAKSASTELDVSAIIAACDEVDSKAYRLQEANNEFYYGGNDLSADVLSINGKTFSNLIMSSCDRMLAVNDYIQQTTAQIREAAVEAYNTIQTQLNEEAEYYNRIKMEEAVSKKLNYNVSH